MFRTDRHDRLHRDVQTIRDVVDLDNHFRRQTRFQLANFFNRVGQLDDGCILFQIAIRPVPGQGDRRHALNDAIEILTMIGFGTDDTPQSFSDKANPRFMDLRIHLHPGEVGQIDNVLPLANLGPFHDLRPVRIPAAI